MQDLRCQIANKAALPALAEALAETQETGIRRTRHIRISDQVGDPGSHTRPAFRIEQAPDAPPRRRHQHTHVLEGHSVESGQASVRQPLLKELRFQLQGLGEGFNAANRLRRFDQRLKGRAQLRPRQIEDRPFAAGLAAGIWRNPTHCRKLPHSAA